MTANDTQPTAPKNKTSIARNLTVSLILTVVLVSTTAISVIYLFAAHNAKVDLSQRADETLSELVGTLKTPIWQLDMPTIEAIGVSFARNELICRLKISDSLGTVFYDFHRNDPSVPITRNAAISHRSERIALIELSMTRRIYDENNRRLIVASLLTVLAVVVSLRLMTGFFLRRFLKQPFNYLRRIVKSYENGNPDSGSRPMALVEFDPVIEAFEEMGRKIAIHLEELRRAEERYRSIVENAVEGIFQITTTGQFVRLNRAYAKIFGYASAQAMLESVSDIGRKLYVHPERREEYLNALREQKTVSGFVSQFYHKDGRKIWVEFHSRLVEDRESDQVLIEGTCQDVTDIKRVEAKLQKHQQQLELMVTERTTELVQANAQLHKEIAEREQAEEIQRSLEEKLLRSEKMEAIGTLAGGVAHDLNNILSGIVSYPDLLLMDLPADSPMRGPVVIMQEAGKRAAEIVQDLLTLARRGVAVKETVNLNRVISEYLATPEFHVLRDHHDTVRFETDLEPDLLCVTGSPLHLSKSVMNLVANAAEAILPDGGVVAVRTRSLYLDRPVEGYDRVQQGEYVVVSVSDTGIGIDGKELKKIFEPFYTKKTMGRSGTGLGMAVVWATVKDHHGYIDVQSREGKGTTVDLYFPVTRTKSDTEKTTVALEDLMGSGQSILVVDDVAEQREIASRMLETMGYRVSVVSSGEEAVAFVRKNRVDLVLLDMILDRGLDGLETFRQIIRVRPDQRAIIASGFSENARVRKAQKLGVGAYVQKPYTMEKIGQAVKAEITRRRDS